MNIGIITAPYSRQANTVKDSIECFEKYGNFSYHKIWLQKGEITPDLSVFDALIVHYSCIAFPFRYHLPMSALTALKISEYEGPKLAFVQDEQRAGRERLNFLNMLGIKHLFSVAEDNIYELLYPGQVRNFSISTVLTGYITDDHIKVAGKKVPLLDRSLDLLYRGRILPDWMGATGTIKGRIPHLVASNPLLSSFSISVSELEKDRVYGEAWYEFLKTTRVSIGTPSGSDYLDIHGKYSELWVPPKKEMQISKDPIRANYQVVSPRYFDYIAAGNLVALTPGEYSNIPVPNTYRKLSNNLEELPEILNFARSQEAQKIVDLSQEIILFNEKYHFRELVRHVEEVVDRVSKAYPSLSKFESSKAIQPSDPIVNRLQFIKILIRRLPYIIRLPKIDSFLITLVFYKNLISASVMRQIFYCVQAVGINKFRYKLSPFLVGELLFLYTLVNSTSRSFKFDDHDTKQNSNLEDSRFFSPILITESPNKKCWLIEISMFGCLPITTNLRTIPKLINYDKCLFAKLYSSFRLTEEYREKH